MTIRDLKKGQCGTVTAVGGSDSDRKHFLDIGLIPGAAVTLVGRAPMGDPVQIRVQGYSLSLRASEAEHIEVKHSRHNGEEAPSAEETDFGYNLSLHEHNSHPGFGEEGKYHNHSGEHAPAKNGTLRLAITGQPNSGKTALFNFLTGSSSHVGNFPGITTEREDGTVTGHPELTVTDLPGIYSLNPYTAEEALTCKFLEEEKPDAIINIADATNIERHLYLTVQLMGLGIPVVLALNMMDELTESGGSVRLNEMERCLGIPVVPVSVSRGDGIEELLQHAVHIARYGETPAGNSVPDVSGLDYEEAARLRYDFIGRLRRHTVRKPSLTRVEARTSGIDRVLTGRWTAIPSFVAIIGLVFWLTFDVIGLRLQQFLAAAIAGLSATVDAAFIKMDVIDPVRSLVSDAIFGGVGTVLSFVPIILVLFLFLSILEDSGYMSRIAFVSDKLLRKTGLSGRSIVPMLIGFGCTVPGVMAARTLPSSRDRRRTILMMPFLSCSAKTAVYGFLTAAFFPGHAGLIMAGLYILGIVLGVFVALVRKWTGHRRDAAPFVMELPPYRIPQGKNLAHLLWDKTKDFLQMAFTVIFVATLAIWFLQSFNFRFHFVEDSAESMLAWIAGAITPVMKPIGLGDWRLVTALISGLLAKESIVAMMEMLGAGAVLTTASAASMLVFSLLYSPCIASITAIRRELGRKSAAFVVVFQCAVAWVCAFAVYMILV